MTATPLPSKIWFSVWTCSSINTGTVYLIIGSVSYGSAFAPAISAQNGIGKNQVNPSLLRYSRRTPGRFPFHVVDSVVEK